MKNKILYIIMGVLLFIPVSTKALVTSSSKYKNVNSYLFVRDDCKKCDEVNKWLEEENSKSPYTQLIVLTIKDNKDLYDKVKEVLKIKNNSFPLLVIGSNYFSDFDKEEKINIVKTLEAYKTNDSCNLISIIQRNEDTNNCLKENDNIYNYFHIQNFNWSINLVTIFLGIVNALNPLLILSFLIILNIWLDNKKKLSLKYALINFALTSILMIIYLVLANLLKFKVYIYLIAILGILLSIKEIYKIIKNNKYNGMSQRLNNTINKEIKKITEHRNYIHLVKLTGIIIISALLVNFIPVIYTQVLSSFNYNFGKNIIYILGFNLFSLLLEIGIYCYCNKRHNIVQLKSKLLRNILLVSNIITVVMAVLLIIVF